MPIITLDAVKISIDPYADWPSPAGAGYGFMGLDAGPPSGTFSSAPLDIGDCISYDGSAHCWRLYYSYGTIATAFTFDFTNVEVDTDNPPEIKVLWEDPLDYEGAEIELSYFYDGEWTVFHTETASEYYLNTVTMTLPEVAPTICWTNKVRTNEVL